MELLSNDEKSTVCGERLYASHPVSGIKPRRSLKLSFNQNQVDNR